MIRVGEYNRQLESVHWWWRGRRAIVDVLLSQLALDRKRTRILDIGCGSGGNLPMLRKHGRVLGVDPDVSALRLVAEDWVLPGTIQHIATPDNWIDVAVSMDVLEHIEDDAGALREIWRVLRPRGYLVITVPAYQFLWSAHDDSLGHVRRYTRDNLVQRVTEAGFRVVRASHFVMLAFPGVLGYRFLFRSRDGGEVETPSAPINDVLVRMLTWEAEMIRTQDLPFGSSIVVVAQRPQVAPSDA